MVAAIDTGVDYFRQALALRAYRQEILSADIANASTPGFKAVDLDFAGAFQAAAGRKTDTVPPGRIWLIDNGRHMTAPATAGTSSVAAQAASYVDYQASSDVTLDGNSVDLNQEKVAAAENAVQYEAATTFASLTIRMLTTAIAGSSGSQQSSGG